MWHFVVEVLVLTAAIFGVAQVLPGIKLRTPITALPVAVVYSIVDTLLFKLLVFLSFPLVLLTAGLAILFINAGLLWLTDKLMDDFEIRDLPTTFLAALLISVFKLAIGWVVGLIF